MFKKTRHHVKFYITILKNFEYLEHRDTQLLAENMPYLFANAGISPSEYYKSYIETYLERDIAMQNQVHGMAAFERMLRLLAARTGQLLNEPDTGISTKTLKGWLSILESTHIIYILKPWYSSWTSREVKTPKIYFCDTGIVWHRDAGPDES